MAVIEVNRLSKEFPIGARRRFWKRAVSSAQGPGVKVALEPTSFTVGAGETIGFIGPNGAGKSTTIKMLTGILHPTSGDARVLGLCPWQDRIQLSYRIATVFGQKSQLWYHLPPKDTFTLMGKIYELDRKTFVRRRDELVDRFSLGPLMDTPVRRLSLGERMRCEIGLSFLHHPEILFLDEPTIGLDVLVKQTIRELIRELNEQDGVTVFLTSHDASDIETLSERVLVVHSGRLVFDGPTERLVSRFLHYKEVHFTLLGHEFDFKAQGVTVLRDGQRITVRIDTNLGDVNTVVHAILSRFDIADIQITAPSMEQIIREIYTEQEEPNGEAGQEGDAV